MQDRDCKRSYSWLPPMTTRAAQSLLLPSSNARTIEKLKAPQEESRRLRQVGARTRSPRKASPAQHRDNRRARRILLLSDSTHFAGVEEAQQACVPVEWVTLISANTRITMPGLAFPDLESDESRRAPCEGSLRTRRELVGGLC